MEDRFKFRFWDKNRQKMETYEHNLSSLGVILFSKNPDKIPMQCTGLKDKNGTLIYEGDIVVIPSQYPYFDYPKGVDKNLNDTYGKIEGEAIPNYRATVEWIYSQWQVIQYCVNPDKSGTNNGMNYGLDDEFEDGENTYWEIIGNIYEHKDLLNA